MERFPGCGRGWNEVERGWEGSQAEGKEGSVEAGRADEGGDRR